jgi:hypothetical protein
VSRTNIEIDDRLVALVMRRYRLASKREAVDLALEGSGWEGNLDQMRRSRVKPR